MQVTDKMKSDGENCPKLVLRIIPLFWPVAEYSEKKSLQVLRIIN
jgi:hypothetical protein